MRSSGGERGRDDPATLDEHWEAAALAAVERYRRDSPQGWADYLAEAEDLAVADALITDEWSPR